MKKILALAALLALLLPALAIADSYETVPGTSLAAKWDTTTGAFVSLGVNGQPTTQTVIPTVTGTNIFTGTNTFSGSTTVKNAALVGPVPVACGATCSVTAANAGGTVLLSAASGSVATLPAATGTGNVYRFVVSVTVTSVKDAILAASSSDAILGLAIGENGNTPLAFVGSAGTYHSLQMPFAGTQPSGGFKGDSFTCQDISANVWECNGTYQGGTTPTTPFSTATS